MTTFYLIRHGKRVSRSEDTELSEAGIKQAEQLAEYLENLSVSTIMTSPLNRTQQTAHILANKLNLPIQIDSRLLERIEFDASKGKTFAEFLEEWNQTMADRDYQPFYGDSAKAAGARLKKVLDERSDDQSHLIISHGGVIGDVVRNIFSDEVLSLRTDPIFSLSWLEITECSITEIQKKDGKYFLKRVNDTSYLS